MEEAKSIFKTIFPTYNRNVPPRKDFPAPIMLDLTADVVHVSDLDAVRHVLTSTVDVSVVSKLCNKFGPYLPTILKIVRGLFHYIFL